MKTTIQCLAEMPDLAALLPVVAGTSTSPGTTSRRTPGSQPPASLDIIQALDTRIRTWRGDATDRAHADAIWGDHRQGVLPDLWLWARMIEAEMLDQSPQPPATIPDQITLAGICDWLIRHNHWAVDQPWHDQYDHDVHSWHRRLTSLAGLTEPRIMRHQCSACEGPSDLTNDGDLWTCRSCGHLDPGPRRQITDYRLQPSQPTNTICTMFGVSGAWLRQQKARHRLTPDLSKGTRPLHWWPWDVFALLNPGIVEAYEQHAHLH